MGQRARRGTLTSQYVLARGCGGVGYPAALPTGWVVKEDADGKIYFERYGPTRGCAEEAARRRHAR